MPTCSRSSEPFGPFALSPVVGSYCYFVHHPNQNCFVLNDGVVVQAGTQIRAEAHVGGHDFGGYPAGLCEAVYPACDSDAGEVQVTDGNPLSGCHVTGASCGAVSGGVVDDDGTACECNPTTHEGTFPTCTAITGTRTVSVSISANGVVVATVDGTVIAEGESTVAMALSAVTFTATPTVGYYVSAWTGDCEGTGDVGVDGATTTETCVLNPGNNDVAAGATFSAITDLQRITADEVFEDCAAAGGSYYGVDRDGNIVGATNGTLYCGSDGCVGNPVNFCWFFPRANRCYSVRPGFSIPQGVSLIYDDEGTIDISATCDLRYPDCAAQGKTDRIPGNELSGCVDSE